MPGSTEIIKPTVKSAQSGHVDNLVLYASIGEFPTAEVKYHVVGSGISKAVPSDIAGKMASSQNGIYKGLQKDQITINDGTTEKTFSGYLVNGAYTIATGNIGYSHTMIHSSSIIDMFQTGIYSSPGQFRDFHDAPAGGAKYSSWMKVVIDDIIDQWQKSADSDTNSSEATKAYTKKIHGENAEPIKVWDSILASSEDENSYLESMNDSKNVMLKNSLLSAIKNIYTQSMGNFTNSIKTFGAQFQTAYVPTIFSGADAPNGKFIKYSKMVESGETKSLSIRGMSVKTGISQIIPIGQVAVHGTPAEYYRNGIPKGAPGAIPPEIAVFPSSAIAGRSIRTMAPSWLPVSLDMGSETPTVLPENYDKLDGSAFMQAVATLIANKGDAKGNVHKAVVEWAKNMYVDLAISGAVAELSIKLDISWELGKTYSVESKSDSGSVPLFVGFLAGITHSINSTPGSPNAATQLLFTHVRAVGFTLPGL